MKETPACFPIIRMCRTTSSFHLALYISPRIQLPLPRCINFAADCNFSSASPRRGLLSTTHSPRTRKRRTCRSLQMDIIMQRQPWLGSNHHRTSALPSLPDAGPVSPLQTPSRLIHSGAANAIPSLHIPSPSIKHWLFAGANRAGHRCTMRLWHTPTWIQAPPLLNLLAVRCF